MLRPLLDELLEVLYPPLCPVCGAASVASQGTCDEHALPASAGAEVPRCDRCALPLASWLPGGTRCAACRRQPPRFGGVVSLGDYRAEPGLRAWILALKYGGRPDLARPLGRVLGRRLVDPSLRQEGSAREPGTWIVPVPLHPLRRLERGYDQARLLAKAVAEELGLPLRPLLRRVRWGVPQGSAGARSRRANVRAAFSISSRAISSRLAADLALRPVILVDDVVTSGATADACAAVLRRAGAASVVVLCAARAGPSSAAAGGPAVDEQQGPHPS